MKLHNVFNHVSIYDIFIYIVVYIIDNMKHKHPKPIPSEPESKYTAHFRKAINHYIL